MLVAVGQVVRDPANKWDWNLEAKKPVQESLVKGFTKVEKHTGNTLPIFQNRVPLMGG